jgi:TRAP-type C4-dicarboxylate transport system substrate-binding protein
MKFNRVRLGAPLVATMAVAALALAGCAESDGGGSGGGGESVPAGSDKQVFIDALADMDPVTLAMQSTAPKGAATGRRFEEYAAAVEEWSGGKITFDIAYSNAIAPVPEVDDALVDGRLDIGSVIVALEPSKFPVNNALWDLSFIGSQQPVEGMLQWHGAMVETAVGNEAIQQEFEDNGLHPLLPTFGSGSYFLNCVEPGKSAEDFSGRTIASQSQVQSAEAEALGMSPSTISYAEMFESLERGVVDCAASSMTTSSLGGFIPAAPHFAYSPDTGLAAPGGTLAIGTNTWDSLPLAAQQLLQDRMDVVLHANFEATWENVDAAMAAIEEAGGSVQELDSSATEAIAEANDAAVERVRGDNSDLVEGLLAAEESWVEQVGELGIDGLDVDYNGFRDWYAGGTPELDSYFEVLQDALAEQRPS